MSRKLISFANISKATKDAIIEARVCDYRRMEEMRTDDNNFALSFVFDSLNRNGLMTEAIKTELMALMLAGKNNE